VYSLRGLITSEGKETEMTYLPVWLLTHLEAKADAGHFVCILYPCPSAGRQGLAERWQNETEHQYFCSHKSLIFLNCFKINRKMNFAR